MQLSQPEPDIPHSADEFTCFFANKVSRIRDFTASAPPLSYSNVQPSCSRSRLELVTVESVTQLVMKAPNKHSKLDPLPTWLLKQCVAHFLHHF